MWRVTPNVGPGYENVAVRDFPYFSKWDIELDRVAKIVKNLIFEA